MEIDLKQRVEIAERHLANVQGFYPRIDTRVGAVFAISTAQLAIAAVNISTAALQSYVVIGAIVGMLLSSALVHVSLYVCTFPNLVGGSRTLMFFGHIANYGEADFFERYRILSMDEIHCDLTKQIWRSSQILSSKYYWLKVASIALAFATACWVVALTTISLKAGVVPTIK
jgi:hypothetical protein